MNRTPIESSMIHDVGYDPETQTLEIGFNGGKVYQYSMSSRKASTVS